MRAIHLIQKDPGLRPWPTTKRSPEYESGFWDFTESQAANAIGAEIYFHGKQNEPPFFGGVITGFRVKGENPWKGRINFSLRATPEFKGRRTSNGGWAMEMKIIK